MKLVVGLGNPGIAYVKTRHNAGFLLADNLTSKSWAKSKNGLFEYSWTSSDIEIIKPLTFMNESGKAVSFLVKKHGIEPTDLYILHDDLDIPLGQYKIQFGKGPKEHNGVKSIDEALGTNQYWHVRVGIENRDENKISGEDYVLQNFTDEEKNILDEVIKKACHNLIHNLQLTISNGR